MSACISCYHTFDFIWISKKSPPTKSGNKPYMFLAAAQPLQPLWEFLRPQHIGVGQFAAYPVVAEAFVHDPCVPHYTGFRKAARCIVACNPALLGRAGGALWFHPAWGVRTAVGKMGRGGAREGRLDMPRLQGLSSPAY
jgi:hypothetical protein